MLYSLNADSYTRVPLFPLGDDFTGRSAGGDVISFNNHYMELNGKPFIPVSGEFHYSRMDPARWEDELIKMRMGGINVVSTYLFWNHIEEDEGVFDFTGRRDVAAFTRLCAKHGLYVILRIGPFAHGEARNGGLPDWLYGKPYEVRSTDEGFMKCVRRLYGEIGKQVKGLFFRDGGPVIAVQLDNEYMHSSAMWEITTGISNEWIPTGSEGEKYLLMLRDEALAAGMEPAFFTGTAWGGAAYSSRIMPLWGGYAYWPWIFYSRRGEHPATPGYVYEDYHHDGKTWADDFAPAYPPSQRPYACCEMGGGMMNCYYYRFQLDYKSVDAMANIKLGSGCCFPGYYMYHGGTNPIGRHGAYLNESQVSKLSYDYQACIGEFGQVRESYKRLKTMHFFTRFFGSVLAPMETVLPEGASAIDPGDLETLRFCARTDGRGAFVFINNFQDHRITPAKTGDVISVSLGGKEYTFNVSLASGENAILPINLDLDGILLVKAQAQPVLRTVINGRITYVFMIPDGMQPSFTFEDGAQVTASGNLYTVSLGGKTIDIMLVDRDTANNMYLLRDGTLLFTEAAVLEDENGRLRIESDCADVQVSAYPARDMRAVTELPERQIPVTAEPSAPQRWTISIPADALDGLKDARLQIRYRGDIAALFLNGRMINDNFCNGDVWEIGLKEHIDELRDGKLVLKISPVRKGAVVNVESAMAGRSETVQELVSELTDIRIQPVYEYRL